MLGRVDLSIADLICTGCRGVLRDPLWVADFGTLAATGVEVDYTVEADSMSLGAHWVGSSVDTGGGPENSRVRVSCEASVLTYMRDVYTLLTHDGCHTVVLPNLPGYTVIGLAATRAREFHTPETEHTFCCRREVLISLDRNIHPSFSSLR